MYLYAMLMTVALGFVIALYPAVDVFAADDYIDYQ